MVARIVVYSQTEGTAPAMFGDSVAQRLPPSWSTFVDP